MLVDGVYGWMVYFYAAIVVIAVLVDMCLDRKGSAGRTALYWTGITAALTVPAYAILYLTMSNLNQLLWVWFLIPLIGTIGAVTLYDCDRRRGIVASAYCSTVTMVWCGIVCMTLVQIIIPTDLDSMRYTFLLLLIPVAIATVLFTRKDTVPRLKEYMDIDSGDGPPFFRLIVIVETFTFLCYILWFYEFGSQTHLLDALALVNSVLLLVILRLILITVTEVTTAVRTDAELETAAKIQKSVLPEKDRLSWMSAFDVTAIMEPAKVVGGDFYDMFTIDSRKVVFVMADVSDKGVASALFMMRAWSTIRNKMMSEDDLGSAISAVSGSLMEDNPTSMFVTAFIGKLDLNTGTLEYVNAGHIPPVITTASGTRPLECSRAPFLGMRPFPYRSDSIVLKDGDMVTMFTDGVTEAESKGSFYGEERALGILSECRNTSESVSRLKDDVRSFAGENDNPDDLTILSFMFKETSHHRYDLSEGDPVDAIMDFISDNCEGLPQKLIDRVELAAEEAVVNIVEHGTMEGDMEVTARRNADGLTLVLTDNGPRFNVVKARTRDRNAPLEDRIGGGEGIRIIRMMSDDISYRYTNGRNILTLRFIVRDGESPTQNH